MADKNTPGPWVAWRNGSFWQIDDDQGKSLGDVAVFNDSVIDVLIGDLAGQCAMTASTVVLKS